MRKLNANDAINEIEQLTFDYARIFHNENVNECEIESISNFTSTMNVVDQNTNERIMRYTFDIARMRYHMKCAINIYTQFILNCDIVSNISTLTRDEYYPLHNEFVVDAQQQMFVKCDNDANIVYVNSMLNEFNNE